MDKDFYNKSSADSLGWDPSWFGCTHFDDELLKAVRKWQRDHGLTADGLVGPMTYRRIWTEREASISDYQPKGSPYSSGDKHIVHNGKFIAIEWDKVVLWDEEGGLKCNKGNYYDYSGKPDRKPTHFVNHWDVCLSSESMAKVINKRGVSMHFGIDNDGTIYQLLDTQHGAWQAGNRYGNKHGIGVEVANAYYQKYQDWYVRNGFGPRPLQENGVVHGKVLDPFLWFYPVQLDALKALWKAMHTGLEIPLEYPVNSSGEYDTGLNSDVANGRFSGFCNHYNFTRKKIDCAGLDIPGLMQEIKNSPLYCQD